MHIAFHNNNGYANVPQCYVHTFTACLVRGLWLRLHTSRQRLTYQ